MRVQPTWLLIPSPIGGIFIGLLVKKRMENQLYISVSDVETTKIILLPEKAGILLPIKDEIATRGIEASELFSYFTANIIKEEKVFTR